MPTRSLFQLVNMALRGMTLASKFLLIFFLAKFLDPTSLGLYGLLVATIGYALYLLGLDFYTYSTREILKHDRSEWGGLLKSQGGLTLALYCLFIPLLLLLFSTDTLPWSVAIWFFPLLVLEHANQELMRFLIAVSEPLVASLVLFLRSGAWAIAVTGLMLIEPDARHLDAVLAAWVIGGAGALTLAVSRLYFLKIGGWQQSIDWRWIVRGIRVALPLLVATLALRGLFTLDRYWIEALAGLEVLGAYVLFIGICNAMMSFLDAGVFAFIYPKLISAYQEKRAAAFRSGMKKLLLQTLLFSAVFAITAMLLISPLLTWLDKPLYQAQLDMFPWMLLAIFLYAVGMVPHFALYAQRLDRPLVHSHFAGLAVFAVTTWLFSLQWPQLAVLLGLCVAFLLILFWKTVAYFLLTNRPYRYIGFCLC